MTLLAFEHQQSLWKHPLLFGFLDQLFSPSFDCHFILYSLFLQQNTISLFNAKLAAAST